MTDETAKVKARPASVGALTCKVSCAPAAARMPGCAASCCAGCCPLTCHHPSCLCDAWCTGVAAHTARGVGCSAAPARMAPPALHAGRSQQQLSLYHSMGRQPVLCRKMHNTTCATLPLAKDRQRPLRERQSLNHWRCWLVAWHLAWPFFAIAK